MDDAQKTNAQLVAELAELRQKVTRLETAEIAWKRAEENLRDSHANYQSFFDTVDDLVIIGTAEGRILYTNRAVSEN